MRAMESLLHFCITNVPAVPAGLWFDLDVSYSGSFLMTLETKMNLIRLGKEDESSRVGEVGKDGWVAARPFNQSAALLLLPPDTWPLSQLDPAALILNRLVFKFSWDCFAAALFSSLKCAHTCTLSLIFSCGLCCTLRAGQWQSWQSQMSQTVKSFEWWASRYDSN